MDQSSRSLIVSNIIKQGNVAASKPSSIIQRKSTRVASDVAVALVDSFLNAKGCCRRMGVDDNTLFYYMGLESHYVFARGTRLWLFISRNNLRSSFLNKISDRMIPLEDGVEITVTLLPELRKSIFCTVAPSKCTEIFEGKLDILTKNFIDLMVKVGKCNRCDKNLIIPFFVFEECSKLGLAPTKFYDFYGQRVGLFSNLEKDCSLVYFSHLDEPGVYNL